MILADTSAWVEFDRATGSPVDTRLAGLIGREHTVAVTEPVIMEVLAGARSAARERDLGRLLAICDLRPFDSVSDFTAAARIYRACRADGVTPRGLIDCMIAAVALRDELTLLAHDADLARVAGVMNIKLDRASLSIM